MAGAAPFAKMNGLGNEIIVADMRGRADRVSPAAAIALNADPATNFDQIMAIHDARTPGTANYIEIINSDGTMAQACGNGMRCVVQALAAETRAEDFHLRDRRRHPERRRACRRTDFGRHGRAALRLAGHSARRGIPRHPHDRIADRPDRRSGAAFAVGGVDGQSARRLLGRPRRLVLRTRPFRAAARKPPDFSRARQHHHRAGHLPRRDDHPHLGARRRPDQGLRLGRLRRRRQRRPHQPHGPDRHRNGPRRPAEDRMARRRPCRHDRSRRMGIFRHVRPGDRAVGRATVRTSPDGGGNRHLRLPAEHLRIRGDAPRGGKCRPRRAEERRRHLQYLRRHRRGRAPGQAVDPQGAPRKPARPHHRHRLRRPDRSRRIHGDGRGRPRARQ